ncbi:MAG: fatty acid desaturase [Synechococcus sp.]
MSDKPRSNHPAGASCPGGHPDLGLSGASHYAPAFPSPRELFTREGLAHLNQRSNIKGAAQLLGHCFYLTATGYVWLTQLHNLWLGLPALLLYGLGIATTFMPLHECVHRTVFDRRYLNDSVAWLTGVVSVYNSTFYRRYHKWHHRYTRVPGRDPELTDPTPTNLQEYLWHVSGIPWWLGKLQTYWLCATGQMEEMPYIPEDARSQVQRSVLLQCSLYVLAIAMSVYVQYPWFVLVWLLPMAIGQPILRLILLAEHTDCTLDANPFTNTRTTLTWPPLRWLLWNMPYHAEHHFCPSIPFHKLGLAHQQLGAHLRHVGDGYSSVNLELIGKLRCGEKINPT